MDINLEQDFFPLVKEGDPVGIRFGAGYAESSRCSIYFEATSASYGIAHVPIGHDVLNGG
ncbi:ORF46 [Fowl aviadenovirus C]|uniref:ORF46 n=1 Tax=Fowl aviadenovirus C TaxID=190063 RepID=A0A650BZ51_9ADEN|nr:ORF46 [Fowl aviadenovirus C]